MSETSTSRDPNHPVWNVYDGLRTAKLNVEYYSEKLKRSQRYQLLVQITLAAAVPSSAIAGFDIWNFFIGQYAWEILTIISSILAFLHPFLGITKRIDKYRELVDGYKILFYDIGNIREKIEIDRNYNAEHQQLFRKAMDRKRELEIKETGISIDRKLQEQCQEIVKRELPSKSFFIPSN